MKVYLVEREEYHCASSSHGIFSSEDKAREWIDAIPEAPHTSGLIKDEYFITEFILDQPETLDVLRK